jgi:hypothetical protein
MSGAPLMLAGTASVATGLVLLAWGFAPPPVPARVFAGAAMVLAGLLLHAIGRRVTH